MLTTDRSSRPDVRNPVLRLLPSGEIEQLSPEARLLLIKILTAISFDARKQANKSWKTHKAPMAAYWKAVAVYARHICLAIRSQDRKHESGGGEVNG